MSYEAAVQEYFRTISAFWIKALQRWQDARTSLQANAYTADNFASDFAGTWMDGMDAWFTVPPLFGAPLVPTIFLTVGLAALVNQKPKNSAFIGPTLPDGVVPTTDLARLGGKETVPSANVTASVTGGKVEVVLQNLNAVNPALVAGLYQGLAYSGTTPLALIVVQMA